MQDQQWPRGRRRGLPGQRGEISPTPPPPPPPAQQMQPGAENNQPSQQFQPFQPFQPGAAPPVGAQGYRQGQQFEGGPIRPGHGLRNNRGFGGPGFAGPRGPRRRFMQPGNSGPDGFAGPRNFDGQQNFGGPNPMQPMQPPRRPRQMAPGPRGGG